MRKRLPFIIVLVVGILLVGCAPYSPNVTPGMDSHEAFREMQRGVPFQQLVDLRVDPDTGMLVEVWDVHGTLPSEPHKLTFIFYRGPVVDHVEYGGF